MIKIGLTTDEGVKPVKGPGGIQRIQDQVYGCNRNFVCVYPAQSHRGAKARPGQFAYRVEELIMAELVKCRREVFCIECLKFHIEWFETSIGHGIAVIEKYSAYAKYWAVFGSWGWSLAVEVSTWRNRAICEPLSLTKTTPRSAGKHIARTEVEETESDSDDDSYGVYTESSATHSDDSDDDDLTVCTDSTLTAGESSIDSNDEDSGSTETLDDMLARLRVRR